LKPKSRNGKEGFLENKSKNKYETEVEEKSKKKPLKDLEVQIAKVEKQQRIKIEEKRISKEFDVSLINADDVEKLLKFLQLNPEDDKYTLDRKLTNKSGYPKMIVFDGFEGSYSDTHSLRASSSSYKQKRTGDLDENKSGDDQENRYSVIHKPKNAKADANESVKQSNSNDYEKVDKPKDLVKGPKQKELVAIDEDELNAQAVDPGALENIISPDGRKEEWKVEDD